MDDYFKMIINELPIKISKSDAALTTAEDSISLNVTAKGWVVNKLNSSILQYQEKCLWPR